MDAPRCIDGGHVVGANEWLPTNSYDYDWGAPYPRIGCSNLRCATCGSHVRSFAGRELAPDARPAAIFALLDWEHAASLVSSGGGRVYACACRVHQEFGTARRDLGYYLREAIGLRLALRDDAGVPLDPPAHGAVRADVLAGRGTMDLVLQIGEDDPQWLAQHGASIVGARPDLLDIVLRAFRRQPESIAVSAVATIARAGAATPERLREGLAALSEPNRSAMLKAVDDT